MAQPLGSRECGDLGEGGKVPPPCCLPREADIHLQGTGAMQTLQSTAALEASEEPRKQATSITLIMT